MKYYIILRNVISLTKTTEIGTQKQNFKHCHFLKLFIGNVLIGSFLLRGTKTIALVPILPQKVGYFIAVWGDMGKNNVRVKPSLEKARHKNVGGFIFIVIT